MRASLFAICALTACGNDSLGEDCDKIGDVVLQENCRLERASSAFEQSEEAFEAELAAIASPESRDLVRLRLAIRDPLVAARLCDKVETDAAKEKCRQVLGRPHLQHAGGK